METTEHIDPVTGTVTVAIDGRLDTLEAQGLRATIQRLLDTTCRQMVIDLTDVHFIDSAGLAVLIHTHRALQANGRALVLIRPDRESARRIFQLTQFDQVLTLRDAAPEQ